MEIAKSKVSYSTRIARSLHFSFQHILEMICVRNASGFISSSSQSINLAFKYYGNNRKPYFLPHSGVKYNELQDGKTISFKGKKMLFISAGKEKIRKGTVYLEEALPKIMDLFPDLKLLHIGEKINWNVPKKYLDRIVSTGKITWDKMVDYYLSADFLLVTSLNEFIPNVIYEAMSVGLPIVTSDLIGIEEVIGHLKNGYVFKRGSSDAIIEAVSFAIKNQEKMNLFSKKSKQMVLKLDYENYSNKLIYFLEHLDRNFNLMPR